MTARKAERARAAERKRDAERTREAILVAAEDRFARLGFEGTTLQQIGEAAGFARSTAAYFFGSKEALYEAALTRTVARAQETIARAYDERDKAGSPEDAVDAYVAAFVDFLHRDPTFVYLIRRESLGGGSRLTDFFGWLVNGALAAFTPAAELAGVPPERLVLDLVALCWYPFAQEETLVSALGMKPRDPAFVDEQKQHLGELVRAMTRRGRERRQRS
jgi:TetR/AcrR family transcriptional regulator